MKIPLYCLPRFLSPLIFFKFCPTPTPFPVAANPHPRCSFCFLVPLTFNWVGDYSTFDLPFYLMRLWICTCQGPWCVFCATWCQVYRGLTCDFCWYSDLISHTHIHTHIYTHTHTKYVYLESHKKVGGWNKLQKNSDTLNPTL